MTASCTLSPNLCKHPGRLRCAYFVAGGILQERHTSQHSSSFLRLLELADAWGEFASGRMSAHTGFLHCSVVACRPRQCRSCCSIARQSLPNLPPRRLEIPPLHLTIRHRKVCGTWCGPSCIAGLARCATSVCLSQCLTVEVVPSRTLRSTATTTGRSSQPNAPPMAPRQPLTQMMFVGGGGRMVGPASVYFSLGQFYAGGLEMCAPVEDSLRFALPHKHLFLQGPEAAEADPLWPQLWRHSGAECGSSAGLLWPGCLLFTSIGSTMHRQYGPGDSYGRPEEPGPVLGANPVPPGCHRA